MKCENCQGTGAVDSTFQCSICEGSGTTCDVCGEAAEVGADLCDDCQEEAEPVSDAIRHFGGSPKGGAA